jgi:hypothetical protein
MDTCKEIPFEQLNSLQVSALPLLIHRQSHHFPRIHTSVHGKNYYMKGVFSSGPQLEVADKLVSRLPQLSCRKRRANLTVVYELIPTKKILSVPNHATAHIRGVSNQCSYHCRTGTAKIQTFSIPYATPQVNYDRSLSKGRKSYQSRSTSAMEIIVSIAWGVCELCSGPFRSRRNRIGCRELWFQSQFSGPLRRKLRQTSEAQTGV